MTRNGKSKKAAKKVQRRNAQFDSCHSEESLERERSKREKAKAKESGTLFKACVHQTSSLPSGCGYMAKLSHYAFTAEQLKRMKRGKDVDLSKCHQAGSDPYSPSYVIDRDAIFAAVSCFSLNPGEDTMATFLDADPRKSDRQIEDEWRRGIRSSGTLIECVNHAKATPERASEALDYALFMGCPMVEIDLPEHLLRELARL